MLWALIGTLHAARVGLDDAVQAVQEVEPWLEAELGRAFLRTPEVTIHDRAQLAELMTDERFGATPEMEEHNTMLLTGSLAIFAPQTQTVYLVKETFEEYLRGSHIKTDELRALVKCVMAHELTHTLQQQYSTPVLLDQGDPIAHLAMVEGHADLVAQRYCRSQQPEVADRFKASAPRAGFGDGGRAQLIYGNGSRLVRQLHEQGGWEAVWRALESPPAVSVLEDAGGLPGAWSDEDLLTRVAGWHTAPRWEQLVQSSFVADLDGLMGEGGPLPHDAVGHMLHASEGARSLFLFAYSTSEGDTLVARRRSGILGDQPLFFGVPEFAPLPVHVRRMRRSERRAQLTDSLRFKTQTYQEFWASTEELVVAAFAQNIDVGVRGFEDMVVALVGAVGEDEDDGLAAESSLWLQETVGAGPVPPTVSPWYRFLLADEAMRAGDALACGVAARQSVDELPAERHGEVGALFYPCVVASEDLDAAAWLAPLAEPSGAHVSHGSILSRIGRSEEAVALLSSFRLEDPYEEELRESLLIFALVDLGDLPAAREMGLAGQGSPQARMWLGGQLGHAGQRGAAKTVLASACPQVEGREARECWAYLKQLK